jgi:uncharacterized DUF497 family protein
MRCFKLLGERVMARTFERQAVELQVRAAVLNRFTYLGTSVTRAVAKLRLGSGETRPRPGCATKPCNYKRSYDWLVMELEWDAAKAASNLQKHGVAFEDAERVFYDAGRIETYDGRENHGEDRWATIGLVYAAVLYVVYTVRNEDTIRLISARKANASEQKQYRQANA